MPHREMGILLPRVKGDKLGVTGAEQTANLREAEGATRIVTQVEGLLLKPPTAVADAVLISLAVTTQPSPTVVKNVALAVQPVVTAKDGAAATVTAFVGVVTASLFDGTGTLIGTVTKTAVAGVASFAGLGLGVLAAGVERLLFTTPTANPGVSDIITVTET